MSIHTVEGYFIDNPNHIYYVNISTGSWDGIEGHVDDDIFFYMDGEPFNVGTVVSEDFVITSLES